MAIYEIRDAKTQDSEAIAEVHVDSWMETYKGILPDAYLASQCKHKRRKMWETIISANSQAHKTLVATVSEQIVGFVNGGEAREKEHGVNGEIAAIYLLKAYQGQGIGKGLFSQLVKFLKDAGISDMYLWVYEDNPTIEIYEAWGGERTKVITDEVDGAPIREVLMVWKNL